MCFLGETGSTECWWLGKTVLGIVWTESTNENESCIWGYQQFVIIDYSGQGFFFVAYLVYTNVVKCEKCPIKTP